MSSHHRIEAGVQQISTCHRTLGNRRHVTLFDTSHFDHFVHQHYQCLQKSTIRNTPSSFSHYSVLGVFERAFLSPDWRNLIKKPSKTRWLLRRHSGQQDSPSSHWTTKKLR